MTCESVRQKQAIVDSERTKRGLRVPICESASALGVLWGPSDGDIPITKTTTVATVCASP